MSRNRWIIAALASAQLLVCVAIVAALWSSIAAPSPIHLYYRADTRVEENVERTVAVGAGGRLELISSGNVVVVADSDGEVRVAAHMILYGEDEEDARSRSCFSVASGGGQVVVRASISHPSYIWGDPGPTAVDLEVHVPADMSLHLKASAGISVVGSCDRDGCPAIVLEAEGDGPLSVSQVSGTLDLTTRWGAGVTVQDVRGTIRVESRMADVSIAHVRDANIDVSTCTSLVSLQDISGNRVAVDNCDDVVVTGASLEGVLDLQTVQGKVMVTDVSASSYRLSTSVGDLSIRGCGGGFLQVETSAGNVDISDAGEVQRAADFCRAGDHPCGDLRFAGSLAPGRYNSVVGRGGDVTLTLPAGAGFDLLASTVSGTVDIEFDVPWLEPGATVVQGEVNGGGPLLSIETSSGDIRLLEAGAEGL
jgi:hypothetical protein